MTLQFLKLYFIAVPVFLTIDLLWIGVIGNGIYRKYMGDLLRTPPNWTAAIIFYLLFLVGLIFFAVNPAIEKDSIKYALFYGAIFGFFTYMTYDLTNLATLNNWPVQLVIIDITWGVVLSASVASGTFFIYKLIT